MFKGELEFCDVDMVLFFSKFLFADFFEKELPYIIHVGLIFSVYSRQAVITKFSCAVLQST